MFKSTLIYVERQGQYLMLHRVSKAHDVNKGKWIGVGGKFEAGEDAFACARRELFEETGFEALDLDYRGIVYFESDQAESEEMHLFTCASTRGEMHACDEGVLQWVDKDKVTLLNLWEGDRIFLKLLAEDAPFFRLLLRYQGDALTESRFLEENRA